MLELYSANDVIKYLNSNNIKNEKCLSFKKSHFSMLKNKGYFLIHKKPNAKRDYFKIDEILKALKDNSLLCDNNNVDAVIDNPPPSPPSIFDYEQPPETEEQKNKRIQEEKREIEMLLSLQKEAEKSKVEKTPDVGDSQAEWNKFWIMERGLKTALERQKLEGSLISVDEAKGLVEKFMNPVVQKMDHLAYDFRNHFPAVDDAIVEYLIDYMNNIKKDAQKYVF